MKKNNPEWKTFGEKKGVVLIHFLHFDKLLAHPDCFIEKIEFIFIKHLQLKVNINLHFLAIFGKRATNVGIKSIIGKQSWKLTGRNFLNDWNAFLIRKAESIQKQKQ